MAKERKPRRKEKSKERGRISRIDLGTAWEPYDGGQVARDMSERRRKTIAAITPVQLSAAPITEAAPTLEATASYKAKGGSTKLTIERRISEQPADIRDAARALSQELRSQANELKQLVIAR
jgi:hypothetical protein